MRLPIAALALLVFAACNSGGDGEAASGTAPAPALEAQATPEPAEAAPSPSQIMITDAGGIDGYPPGSAFDVELVRQALPGYEVIEARAGSEGEEWTVFHVLNDGVVILQVDPDPLEARVSGVRTSHESVVTDTGHGVGSEFGWIFAEFDSSACEAGMEEMSGHVICPAPESDSFHYVFAGSWNGPDGTLPPADQLSGWKVKTVIWSLR